MIAADIKSVCMTSGRINIALMDFTGMPNRVSVTGLRMLVALQAQMDLLQLLLLLLFKQPRLHHQQQHSPQ